MGVIYEHWRPDLNECFYIGISWSAEDVRPYNMRHRNEKHLAVQRELNNLGLSPEVRVHEFKEIPLDCLGNLETLMIAHWRAHIGDRLTNITPGGVNWNWTDELKKLHSEKSIAFYKTEQGREVSKRRTQKLIEFNQTKIGIEKRKRAAQLSAEKLKGVTRPNSGEILKTFFMSEKGKATLKKAAAKRRETMVDKYKTHDGKIRAKNHSLKISCLWKTPSFRTKMMYRDWWSKNCQYSQYWGA